MRDKIVLRRRATPKVVTLPNGRTFTAKWERISRKQLPINIRVKKLEIGEFCWTLRLQLLEK